MNLTTKETELLKDLKSQEQLCIEQYTKYASEAKSETLGKLFADLADTEREHLKTLNDIMSGSIPSVGCSISGNNQFCEPYSYKNEDDKKADALLLKNMLSMEKHVSSVYNTSVFEFKNPQLRKALNHIQSEEQQHGERIYAYMECNAMYN